MNEEKADTPLEEITEQTESTAVEATPKSDAEPADGCPLANSDEPVATCDFCEDPKLSQDTLPDFDSSSALACERDPQAGLEQLRGELTRLRAELAEKEIFWERVGDECDEFRTLYPNVSLKTLPDCVWEDVKKGIPLSAAYALAEKRKAYTNELATENNQKNRIRSSGALAGTENEYFSPQEVRAMSQDEVHANYRKIMRSMQSWR